MERIQMPELGLENHVEMEQNCYYIKKRNG